MYLQYIYIHTYIYIYIYTYTYTIHIHIQSLHVGEAAGLKSPGALSLVLHSPSGF